MDRYSSPSLQCHYNVISSSSMRLPPALPIKDLCEGRSARNNECQVSEARPRSFTRLGGQYSRPTASVPRACHLPWCRV